jgi:transcriptional regulator NrdR family protein
MNRLLQTCRVDPGELNQCPCCEATDSGEIIRERFSSRGKPCSSAEAEWVHRRRVCQSCGTVYGTLVQKGQDKL